MSTSVVDEEQVVKVRTRGTTSKDAQGSSYDVRRRKNYLLQTYRANRDIALIRDEHPSMLDRRYEVFIYTTEGVICDVPVGEGEIACRCYRCGNLLTYEHLTVDRIVPGCIKTAKYPKGGTYVRENIRPACLGCNTTTGAALANDKSLAKKKVRR